MVPSEQQASLSERTRERDRKGEPSRRQNELQRLALKTNDTKGTKFNQIGIYILEYW